MTHQNITNVIFEHVKSMFEYFLPRGIGQPTFGHFFNACHVLSTCIAHVSSRYSDKSDDILRLSFFQLFLPAHQLLLRRKPTTKTRLNRIRLNHKWSLKLKLAKLPSRRDVCCDLIRCAKNAVHCTVEKSLNNVSFLLFLQSS